MRQGVRWAVAIVAVAAIVALLLYARGEPDHGDPSASAAAIVVELPA